MRLGYTKSQMHAWMTSGNSIKSQGDFGIFKTPESKNSHLSLIFPFVSLNTKTLNRDKCLAIFKFPHHWPSRNYHYSMHVSHVVGWVWFPPNPSSILIMAYLRTWTSQVHACQVANPSYCRKASSDPSIYTSFRNSIPLEIPMAGWLSCTLLIIASLGIVTKPYVCLSRGELGLLSDFKTKIPKLPISWLDSSMAKVIISFF